MRCVRVRAVCTCNFVCAHVYPPSIHVQRIVMLQNECSSPFLTYIVAFGAFTTIPPTTTGRQESLDASHSRGVGWQIQHHRTARQRGCRR